MRLVYVSKNKVGISVSLRWFCFWIDGEGNAGAGKGSITQHLQLDEPDILVGSGDAGQPQIIYGDTAF